MRDERVILRLPLSRKEILQAVEAFKQQFGACHLYCQGHVTIETGELCEILHWARVGCQGDELDLLGLGEVEADESVLTWVCPTEASKLLLSTHAL